MALYNQIDSDTCILDGCDRLRKTIKATGGRYRYCNAHQKRLYRHGDVRADVPVGRAAPPDRWCTYLQAHKRVSYFRGAAQKHQCIDCGSQAREWAYRGGAAHEFTGTHGGSRLRWSGDPADYDPRCVKCHRGHDKAIRFTGREAGRAWLASQ